MSEPPAIHFTSDLDRHSPVSSTETDAWSQSRDMLRILVLIAALGIAALGFLGGGLGLSLSLLRHDNDSLSLATLSISVFALTVGLGLVLAWNTWSAVRGRPSPVFRPGKIGFLVLLFVLSLIFGHMVLSQNLLPRLTFPPLHVAATTLPALIILALVGRGLGEITSRRDTVLQLACGAFLGAPLAFVLEAFVLVGLLGATFIGLAARPGSQALIQFWSSYLQDPALLQDPSLLAPLFGSPAILTAAAVFVAGIVPLIEEGTKTVGVGLMAYRKPMIAQAFLWGLAGGAGFAIVEGLLNTSGEFEAWTLQVLVRVGATLLHCFTGALMGIAWYNLLVKRRWVHALGLYAGSVAIHSLWNMLSVGLILLSLGQSAADPTIGGSAISGVGFITILGLLTLLAAAMAFALGVLTISIRKRSRVPHAPESRQAVPVPETVFSQEPPVGAGHAKE